MSIKYPTICFDISGGSTEILHQRNSRNSSFQAFQLATYKLEKIGYTVVGLKDALLEKKSVLYYSFGSDKNYKKFHKNQAVHLRRISVYEPPIVKPNTYRKIDNLTRVFDFVTLYNSNKNADLYKFENINKVKSHLYPQSIDTIDDVLFDKPKKKSIALVASNKKSHVFKEPGLYPERIKALVSMNEFIPTNLFGVGWGSWVKSGSRSLHYIKFRKKILTLYRGAPEDKYEAMSESQFSICFENMIMPGYITEKIFDCFHAGVIPIYLGAPDICDVVPKGCFIDARNFSSYKDIAKYVSNLGEEEISGYLNSIKDYMAGDYIRKYSATAYAERIIEDILSQQI